MKKLVWLFALVFSGTACQPQVPGTQVAAVAPLATSKAKPQVQAPEQLLPTSFEAADTLTAPMRELLHQQDLSKLWQSNVEDRRANPTLEGFFGPDHYRFALVLSEVVRDSQHPELYRMRGKCRYRKNIRPFTGTLTVRQVLELKYPYFLQAMATNESTAADTVTARMYTARAQLQFQEERQDNSGIFEAEALLDFYVVPPAKIDYVTSLVDGIDENTPTRGCGLLLRGKRRNATTRVVKDFVVASWANAAAPDIYKDFMIGERSGEINPKYAKLGWNELWENDEWWAKSPTPSLNL